MEDRPDFTVNKPLVEVTDEEQEKQVETIGRTTKLENAVIEIKRLVTDVHLVVMCMFGGSCALIYKYFRDNEYIMGLLFAAVSTLLGRLSRVLTEEEVKSLREGIKRTVLGKQYRR